jgi:uncharacterized protein (UPF0548 family)
MLELTRPAPGDVGERLARLSEAPFSYAEVGASEAPALPSGYRSDHHCARLGHGAACYARAEAAFRRWAMFDLGWVKLSPPAPPIAAGTVVGISARLFGVWLFNIGRIAYLVDQRRPRLRFGFGIGTLEQHALSGEERFCIEWRADDSVWYDIRTFSRPQTLLALAAYPLVRQLQDRFTAESCAAMARACASEDRPL